MRNAVKDMLARGELVASMAVRLVPGVEIVRIARSAGFDSLYVDLEHSSFTLHTASQLCIMALEAGVPALVRVPANTPEYVSRVLDGGALGVIAPGVRSAEEARAVVAAAKYPPAGSRGLAPGLPHLEYRSVPASQALPMLNEATLVAVQMECAASLAAIDEIAAVQGIDMVLVGSNDLLADLGHAGDYDHPRLAQAYERVLAACRPRGKHVGVGGLGSRTDLVQKFVRMGARFVSTGTDLAFLVAECARRARQVKEMAL